MKKNILSKVEDRTLKVGIIGLGYVGLPLAVEFALSGYDVLGFDVQAEKVEKVNNGINYIGDVVNAELAKLAQEKKLTATTDYSRIKELDFIAICVPTPLDKYQQPNTTYIVSLV